MQSIRFIFYNTSVVSNSYCCFITDINLSTIRSIFTKTGENTMYIHAETRHPGQAHMRNRSNTMFAKKVDVSLSPGSNERTSTDFHELIPIADSTTDAHVHA